MGLYKLIQIADLFGSSIGGVRTECIIEKETVGTEQILQQRIRKESQLEKMPNPYKLDQSYNIVFNSMDFI